MNIFTFYFPVVLWTSLTSAEEEKDCLSPPNTVAEELAEERKESYPHYSVLKYNCRPGYMKEGNIYYMCENGTWKRLNNVVCRRKSCGYPGDAQFGNFSIAEGNDFLFGSRVEYTCNDG
ncbi:complement factor H-like [Protopterus annectens]|uniref:complement factor H-like n=1 Tax=Protopterus annectens TaxID=7888 RepID=UPI001CFC0566|nr:complement factor H-like [Protopterus annectens]